MRLYFHYYQGGFSNCYILGTGMSAESEDNAQNNSQTNAQNSADQDEAIIIDPAIMDPTLLKIIEGNNFTLRGIFITHDHPHHVNGIRAILRIYDTEIYAINPIVAGYKSIHVHDEEIVQAGPFKVEVFSIPGHSSDSAVFKVDRHLFTGDAMSAGLLGSTSSSYAATNQNSALRRKILSLPGDYTVLPGHGPPSTLEAERRFNLDLNSFEHKKNRRPVFRIDW